jgi:hypothetical protein
MFKSVTCTVSRLRLQIEKMFSRLHFPSLCAGVNLPHLHIMRNGGETAFIMNNVGEEESIEAVFVEMDPVQDGFHGVLIELVAVREGYAVVETAAGSGNLLLRFSYAASFWKIEYFIGASVRGLVRLLRNGMV